MEPGKYPVHGEQFVAYIQHYAAADPAEDAALIRQKMLRLIRHKMPRLIRHK